MPKKPTGPEATMIVDRYDPINLFELVPKLKLEMDPELAHLDRLLQHGFVGRGPERIRTRIVEDLVIVRSFDVFTSAEKQLANSYEGRRLIKAMRQQVLEAGRQVLEGIVQRHTGAEVVSIHSDISTKSGEWMDVFVLDRSAEEE